MTAAFSERAPKRRSFRVRTIARKLSFSASSASTIATRRAGSEGTSSGRIGMLQSYRIGARFTIHTTRSPHPKRPPHRLRRDPRPIKTIDQHGELRRRQSNDPALDRRPGEAPLLEPPGREEQTGAVISQDLHPNGSLVSKDKDRPRIGAL